MIESTESHFSFDELFFSRTDLKGVILFGNSVFQRVSQYSWTDIIGRPHNIIRHPDMPKGVFYLFWQTLKSGNPIGAYVKNRSKDGKYYWVFALASGIGDGYLSVRLKPSSSIFEIVKTEYTKILGLEKSQNVSPMDSCRRIEQTIVDLGFKNYRDFMTQALMTELDSRRAKLGRPKSFVVERLKDLKETAKKLLVKSSEIDVEFKKNSLIPLNLTIQAAKLREGGDPITVVANKYSELTREIAIEFENFEKSCTAVEDTVTNCQFFICAATLQKEVIEFYKQENSVGSININQEMEILQRTSELFIANSAKSLQDIIQEFIRFQKNCQELKVIASGLEIVRLTGKIEVAGIMVKTEQFGHFIDELFKFKIFLDHSLEAVSQFGLTIQKISKEISDCLP